MSQITCPHCRRRFRREETSAMPFCSERCRQQDLAKWLDEEHGVPCDGDLEEGRGVPRERPEERN